MADLFTLEQLGSFMQVPEFDTVTLELARELTTIAIREEVGPVTYDALTDLSPFKPIALAVAKRLVSNPDGLRSVMVPPVPTPELWLPLANTPRMREAFTPKLW